jgi:hypothetical protein
MVSLCGPRCLRDDNVRFAATHLGCFRQLR